MTMDSPLAVLPLRGPFHRDLFTQTLQHPNARSFTFGRLNDFDQGKSKTKRPSGDYFSLSNIRGSSPSSLAIEMSQSMSIEPMFNSSPRFDRTPSRSLLNAFLAQAPTTPPLTSSPSFVDDCMDYSPLPHKLPKKENIRPGTWREGHCGKPSTKGGPNRRHRSPPPRMSSYHPVPTVSSRDLRAELDLTSSEQADIVRGLSLQEEITNIVRAGRNGAFSQQKDSNNTSQVGSQAERSILPLRPKMSKRYSQARRSRSPERGPARPETREARRSRSPRRSTSPHHGMSPPVIFGPTQTFPVWREDGKPARTKAPFAERNLEKAKRAAQNSQNILANIPEEKQAEFKQNSLFTYPLAFDSVDPCKQQISTKATRNALQDKTFHLTLPSDERYKPERKRMRRSHSMYANTTDMNNVAWDQQNNMAKTPSLDMSPLKKGARRTSVTAMDIDDPADAKYTLPYFVKAGVTDLFPRIAPETLIGIHQANRTRPGSNFDSVVIDCRFSREFDGGHVRWAVGHPEFETLKKWLFVKDGEPTQRILVFHCEFSEKRAPAMADLVRQYDRSLNMDRYPFLYFPEIYILDGGYFKLYHTPGGRAMCHGGYEPMFTREHAEDAEKGLDKLRHRSKVPLHRAQTYAFGTTEDSPTTQRTKPRRHDSH